MKNQTDRQSQNGARASQKTAPRRLSLALASVIFVAFALCLMNAPLPESGNKLDLENSVEASSTASKFHDSTRNDTSDEVHDSQGASALTEQRTESLKQMLLSAQAIENPSEQNAALNRCLAGVTPEKAADVLNSMAPDEVKGIAAHRLFDLWATSEPRLAMGWVHAELDSITRQIFMNLAALRWAAMDLPEAATWARDLPEGDSRIAMIMAIGQEATQRDPREALRLASELPESIASSELIASAAAEWAVIELSSSLEWALQIENLHLRQQVIEQIALASSTHDLRTAASIALQQMTPGMQQDRALVSIIQRWVSHDPEIASSWVSQFPDDSLGQDAVENLINVWANQDDVAAGKWLSALLPSRMKNAGILAYSRMLERTDAELANRWACSVTYIP